MKTIVDIAVMCCEVLHESFVKYCFKAMSENTEVLPCIYCPSEYVPICPRRFTDIIPDMLSSGEYH